MPIQLLSEQTIAHIAAGEVIERPASVVKELLENALDSGASNIHIAIAQGGRKHISVSDDGTGIEADEIDLAFTRHATSKLTSINDLQQLHTLGFRGEALSSIAAVSHMTLTTRHREEDTGTSIRIEGGKPVQCRTVGVPVGTVITVENLFFNTPARLKFLKKEVTERRHIIGIVSRYAMAYPHVRITLENEGREVFRSTGTGNLADVVVRALGLDNFRHMLEVQSDNVSHGTGPQISVYGFTSTAEYTRSDRTQITLFVNGRWIQDSRLTFGVVQAYHSVTESGRYPVSILMIDMLPDEVDVNVHPTKAEVRFRDHDAVFVAVQRAVRQALVANSGVVLPNQSQQNTLPFRFGERTLSGGVSDYSRRSFDNVDRDDDDVDVSTIPIGPGTPRKPRTLPLLRVVGQIGATYIIAEGPAGMYLIDQNAAHQRVLYEHILETIQEGDVLPETSLSGETVELSREGARLIEDIKPILAQFSVQVENFGANTYRVNALPKIVSHLEVVNFLRTLTETLKEKRQSLEEELALFMASCAAVRTGQVMSQEEMENLVRKLERAESPYNAPDGAPTLLHMSGDQLAREFDRMKRAGR